MLVVNVSAQGEFVGSKNSNKYHYPSCDWSEQIAEDNKVWFTSTEDALSHGYVPCQSCNPPFVDKITVHVDYVIDGDTFNTSKQVRIRLADIDAPESDEAGYTNSTNYLTSLIENKSVILDVDNMTMTDPHDRLVCLVYIQYNSTHLLNVNKAMLDEGYASFSDFTNNEFNPMNWMLFYSIDTNSEPTTHSEPPVASFIYSPYPPRVNDTITFDASESYDIDGTIVEYEWDFGDGTTSTTKNPTHSYNEEGSYTVKLTIIDDDGLTATLTSSVADVVIPEFPSLLLMHLALTLLAIAGIVYKKKLR